MSGPCTDCGGPDYQTLLARIAELEAAANTSICIFCGATMEKDLTVMLAHAEGCEKRPENELMRRIAELEARTEQDCIDDTFTAIRGNLEKAKADAREWADSFKQAEAALDSFLGPDGGKTVIELRAALAEQDRMLDELYGDYEADWTEESGQFVQHDRWLADLRARAEEGGE